MLFLYKQQQNIVRHNALPGFLKEQNANDIKNKKIMLTLYSKINEVLSLHWQTCSARFDKSTNYATNQYM